MILSLLQAHGDDDSVRALRDGELAGELGDIVVRLAEGRARRIGDGIFDRAVGHISHAAGGRDAGHLAGDEAVTRDGNVRAGQRRAVVFLARRLGLQRHGALVDGQLAVDCFGDDILPSRIGLADSTVAKLDGILTGVSAAAGGSDALEGHALGSVAGVAGDRLFLTVIGHGLAVRGL